jgi:hypothetical protein
MPCRKLSSTNQIVLPKEAHEAMQVKGGMLYPVLLTCRNVLLKTLQKTQINNLGLPRNDRF